MIENIEGFAVETEYGCYASRPQSSAGAGVELEVSSGFLTVEGAQGSGYCREQVTSHVPLAVLARLLRAAGWTVEPPVSGSFPERIG